MVGIIVSTLENTSGLSITNTDRIYQNVGQLKSSYQVYWAKVIASVQGYNLEDHPRSYWIEKNYNFASGKQRWHFGPMKLTLAPPTFIRQAGYILPVPIWVKISENSKYLNKLLVWQLRYQELSKHDFHRKTTTPL